jgi:CHAT domain-containing protein
MVDIQYSGRQAFDRAFDYAEYYRNRELLDLLTTTSVLRWKPDQAVLEYSGSSAPLTLRQIQKALPSNAQLVEYVVTEQSLLIWVITADRWVTASVPVTAARLQQLVSDYLMELRARSDQRSLDLMAKDLYRLLIEPVAAHLNEQKILVVVPDGVLNAIPWAALISPASNRYLIEDYTLIVNPSASVTIHMLERGRAIRKSESPSLLVVSNPKFDYAANPDLKALPATEQEFRRIQPWYPHSLNLNQEQATKRTLLEQMNRFEVIQLSTHSVINEQNPMLSSIILATDKQSGTAGTNDQSEQVNDHLQAHEIFRLRLPKTRMVILSSCRSVESNRFRRHSIGGLAHAFFIAGVPTVIASLWEVDDASTAELMTEFHYSHQKEKKIFSLALRQAQLKLLKSANERWRHPYYWAAFLISGDGFTA